MRSERIRSHAERSAIGKLKKESVMQRQERERSTRYRFARIWHLRCQKSWIWWKIPTSRCDDESGKRSSSNLPDRLSVSSQPTIRSPTFSISLAITSLPPNTELSGCKHSGCGRKLAAALPLRYKSPTLLAQPREIKPTTAEQVDGVRSSPRAPHYQRR